MSHLVCDESKHLLWSPCPLCHGVHLCGLWSVSLSEFPPMLCTTRLSRATAYNSILPTKIIKIPMRPHYKSARSI